MRLPVLRAGEGGDVEKFIARQPVFDARRAVYGYELLFRNGMNNVFPGIHLDLACASTTDNIFLFGIERLTQGRRAFINCSRDFLVRDYAALLPRDRVVIEVLETVDLDDTVISACRRLKDAGYPIALDDFVESPAWRPLVDLADFIKVDVLATAPDLQRDLCREFSRRNIRMLAEKVETYEVLERVRSYGYTYFQGYFFSRPEILTRHDVPAYKLNYLRILQAANRRDLDHAEIAYCIKSEASLSYRLLRYLNSPAFFLAVEVRSIPHALMMLGEKGIRRWVSLVVIACMGEDKPPELLLLPLVRARFCELLAPLGNQEDAANDLFLMGLLSAIDAILDMKMEDILREITIRSEIRDALLGVENAFRRIFDVALSYERASWEQFDAAANRLAIPIAAVSDLYVQAMDWGTAVLSGQELPAVKETQ